MFNDKLKDALKQKLAKTISIEISVKNDDDEKQKTSDLAPTVKDSDEPGVDKGDKGDEEIESLESMIDLQPKSPVTQKSLHGRAREKMQSKLQDLKTKKDLKV